MQQAIRMPAAVGTPAVRAGPRAICTPVLRQRANGPCRSAVPARRVEQHRGDKVKAHAAHNADGGDYLARDLFSEFLGCTLFQIIGGCAPAGVAPLANGFGLTLLIFAFGNVSGAHLNPAVSLMMWLGRNISLGKAVGYMASQIAGCVFGATLCTVLVPGVMLGAGLGAPGTFAPAAGLTLTALYAWETILTAVLCFVVYATVQAKPGFGNIAPIGIGLSVFCGAMAAGQYTGAILNPARALGPAIAFGLPTAITAVYVVAQLTGGAVAALLAALFFGDAQA